jgi:hypothetical protein
MEKSRITGEGEDSVLRNKKEKTEHMGRVGCGDSKDDWRAADREDGNLWRTGEGENEIHLERRGWRIERVGGLENERIKENWRRRGRRRG